VEIDQQIRGIPPPAQESDSVLQPGPSQLELQHVLFAKTMAASIMRTRAIVKLIMTASSLFALLILIVLIYLLRYPSNPPV
jgi:hypothetical protein